MQHLFTRGTRGEPTKQTEIGELPESWQVVRVCDVSTNQYGISIAGEESGKYPMLRMNNLSEGRLDLRELQYVNLDANVVAQFRLHRGDVLFNRTNSYELVGKTSLFDFEGDFVFASYLVRVVCDTRHLVPGYLNAYLNWTTTQHRLKMLASRGVSQSNISAGKLSNFAMALPQVAEQRHVVSVLSACETKFAALEREIAFLDELFRALLEKLMTGQLSVASLA